MRPTGALSTTVPAGLTTLASVCAIHSYLFTAAKHGRQLFDTLVMLAEGRGKPWLPGIQST
jgi:hypothetical protein